MKLNKIILLVLLVLIVAVVGTVVIFVNKNTKDRNNNFNRNEAEKVENNNHVNNDVNNNEETSFNGNITLTLEDGSVLNAVLEDNEASRSLINMLPMTLTFEDYANTEKIAYTEEKLEYNNSDAHADPEIGDILIYAPWGNISIFYKEFSSDSGLVYLGKLNSSDVEKIASQDKDFKVTIDLSR